MEPYHKIQTLFKRDMDGSLTGKKGKMMEGVWTSPELEFLADKPWNFREKVDGTNIRIEHQYDALSGLGFVHFGGRTDAAVIPKPLLTYLKETFTHDLFAAAQLGSIAVTLYGEGYGPKIQGGGKYRDDESFVLFDVKIGDFWLSNENVADIASKMGIDSVPLLGTGTLYQAINYVKYGTPYLDEEVRTINRVSDTDWLEGQRMRSQWGNFEAEGIVATPVVDLFNRKGERIITKIKAVDFK